MNNQNDCLTLGSYRAVIVISNTTITRAKNHRNASCPYRSNISNALYEQSDERDGPSKANPEQTFWAKESGTVCSSSANIN